MPLGGCRNVSMARKSQILKDAGGTLGREMLVGVRTGLSFWFVLFNTEKLGKL